MKERQVDEPLPASPLSGGKQAGPYGHILPLRKQHSSPPEAKVSTIKKTLHEMQKEKRDDHVAGEIKTSHCRNLQLMHSKKIRRAAGRALFVRALT